MTGLNGRQRQGVGLLGRGFVGLVFCAALKAASPVWAQTPDGVTIQTNIPYGPLPEETLDLCLPSPGTGLRPSVVLIHGGGWAAGDKANFKPVCGLLARLGFVTANINYRLVKVTDPATFWPVQLVDAQLAVRWLKAHSAEYNTDPKRVCAYGDSAGGHLAVFLGVEKQNVPGDQSSLLTDQSPTVNCVVNNFGPTDLTNPGTPELAAAGAWLVGDTHPKADRDALVGASPLFRVTRYSFPMLVARGMQDTLVAPSQSEALVKALRYHHVPVRQIDSPGGHRWTGLSPEQLAQYLNEEFAYLIEQLHPN